MHKQSLDIMTQCHRGTNFIFNAITLVLEFIYWKIEKTAL